jgi:membrane fusion protein (multidrug efflux system)
MSTPFSRSTRSLEADSHRRSTLGLLSAMGVLGVWVAWLFLARVAVYEVTEAARLEVDSAVHPVASPVLGRVVATQLRIGRPVVAGEVLVELDSKEEQLRLREEEARIEALGARLASMRERGEAEKRAQQETRQGVPLALDEARARYAEAETAARVAAEELSRREALWAQGFVPEMEMVRTRAGAEQRRAAADALRLGISRLDQSERVRVWDRQAKIEDIEGEIAELEGAITTGRATIRRLEQAIDTRRIRAAADGHLGEVADLRIGAVVEKGEKLGTIVPESGELRIVADFPPSDALGRIAPGQPGRLRLAGFPWTEYGSVAATVAETAGEPRAGRVRVELAIQRDPGSRIPLQHGLPGTLEVEVDRISPAALVLRIGGRLLARPVTG